MTRSRLTKWVLRLFALSLLVLAIAIVRLAYFPMLVGSIVSASNDSLFDLSLVAAVIVLAIPAIYLWMNPRIKVAVLVMFYVVCLLLASRPLQVYTSIPVLLRGECWWCG